MPETRVELRRRLAAEGSLRVRRARRARMLVGVGALTLGLVMLALVIYGARGYRSPSIAGSIFGVVVVLLGVWKTVENRAPASHAVLKAELLRTFREVPPHARAPQTDAGAAAERAPRTRAASPSHQDDRRGAPDA